MEPIQLILTDYSATGLLTEETVPTVTATFTGDANVGLDKDIKLALKDNNSNYVLATEGNTAKGNISKSTLEATLPEKATDATNLKNNITYVVRESGETVKANAGVNQYVTVTGSNPFSVKATDNLRTLGMAMKECNLRSIPVVDDENKLIGMASVSDLAKAYFQEITLDSVSASGACINDIANVIEADVLVASNNEGKINGEIKVAAACMEKVAESIKAGDVVIIGNRPESAFIKCIDLKVACVIITGNTTISDEVVTKAKAENVMILSTAFDTYSTARLISQCAPIS